MQSLPDDCLVTSTAMYFLNGSFSPKSNRGIDLSFYYKIVTLSDVFAFHFVLCNYRVWIIL
jgi:hypothetical protein